jgi:hypothetical protein
MYPQATIVEFNSLIQGSTITVAVSTFFAEEATIMLLNKEQRDNFVILVDSQDPEDDGALAEVTEMLHLSPDDSRGTFMVPATGAWYVLSDNRECVCHVSHSNSTT